MISVNNVRVVKSFLFLRHETRSTSGSGPEIVIVAVDRPFAAAATE